MGSDAFFQEFQASFLLPNPEQLLCPPLIGGEPHHLPDKIPHKLVVLGEFTLRAGRLGLETGFSV